MDKSNRNITHLNEGEESFIISFQDKILASKLISMGVLPNSKVHLVRKTINSSTYYVKINNTNAIALRKSEALNIYIN